MKLAGYKEVQELLGHAHNEQTTRIIRSKGFPKPMSTLRCGPIWLEKDIRKWMAKR